MKTSDARDFIHTLEERGYIHQMTDREGLEKLLKSEMVTGYIGFEATASSLHVGSLLQIMLLRRLQQAGHRPLVVMGGATTRIGDPSFKTDARPMLDDAAIAANIASIKGCFGKYLTFGGSGNGGIMVNNAEWFDKLGYVDLLREVGAHFTVNRMLTFDSVQMRLDREQPLTFLEFNYMILQAYDFVELNRRYGCRLQMGGSDQWGNIVNGVELGRRLGRPEFFAVTSPLLTTASGAKMGKSVSGAVWLNADSLAPYDFWQYWRNAEDADVGRFLKLFTELPMDEIARIEKLQGSEINEAKKILAHEVTKLAHGETAALAAAETARLTFEQGGAGGDLPLHEIEGSAAIADILVALGFASSKGEAKRKIEEGAVRLGGDAITSATATIEAASLGEAGLRLSLGKKKHGVLRRKA